MSIKNNTIFALALGACVGASALSRDARACGGEWYPVMQVDPRIHGVAQAEKALSNGRHLAAAASVIRMMPHIKSLKATKPGSLVGRAQRILALSLSRAGGALAVEREVPREVLGSFRGGEAAEREQNIAWSIATLRRQVQATADDVALKTDLAEVLARVEAHRGEARAILEDLAQRDLIASPEGYAALAGLRGGSGDAAGRQLALKRCEAMAKAPDACLPRG
jgi:hypothetical protein